MISSSYQLASLVLAQVDLPAPQFVQDRFPVLARNSLFDVMAWQWVAMGIALACSAALGIALSRLSLVVSRLFSKRLQATWFGALHKTIRAPLACLLALGAFDASVHLIDLTGHVSTVVDTIAYQLLIAGAAWLLVAGGGSLAGTLDSRLVGSNEFTNRGIRTQLHVAHRVFSIVVVVLAVALILSGIHAVRRIGVSLLASAGVASVVIGLAAQKSLGAMLSGVQLSITEPVRIGDSVVVDNEFGVVEEIHLTFVVLRLWDLRRLILPVSKFLESSFQNWTRVETHLVGAVELTVDDGTNLTALREELARVCHASKLWDGQTCTLQVIDAGDKTMKLRALVSADGAEHLFDLRCEVREKLVAFLRAARERPAAVASIETNGTPRPSLNG